MDTEDEGEETADILDLIEALERSLQQQRPAKSRRKPAAKRKRKSA